MTDPNPKPQPPAGGDVEVVARAICLSQGQDPDELAPRTEICTHDNKQLPWWCVYAEHAGAAIGALETTAYLATRRDQFAENAICSTRPAGQTGVEAGFDIDALVIVILHELHSHMPEDERPMGFSDLSDEQAARARKAVNKVLVASMLSKPAGRFENISDALASLPPPAPSGQAVVKALRWFVNNRGAIWSDVLSAHCRGPGSSSAMAEDDRDFRRDLEDAFDRAAAALQGGER